MWCAWNKEYPIRARGWRAIPFHTGNRLAGGRPAQGHRPMDTTSPTHMPTLASIPVLWVCACAALVSLCADSPSPLRAFCVASATPLAKFVRTDRYLGFENPGRSFGLALGLGP